tara:strand:+ start:7 stop:708 length:702 start_codon:yes stop_codon:yes gene_type:complete
MKLLSVIPARGGSKSVEKKNIQLINGFPLIYYTIKEARKVKYITDLIVSTDDKNIAEISQKYGVNVPFIRPEKLAKDDTLSIDVLKHALKEMERIKKIKYDAILMLQPTSPFRKSSHINDSINLFLKSDCDSVVSIVLVNGHHPFRMKRMIGKKIINYIDQGFEDMRPRQDLPKAYIRNGAIYLSKSNVIRHTNYIVGENCNGLVMETESSLNIDNKLDLEFAKFLMEKNEKN